MKHLKLRANKIHSYCLLLTSISKRNLFLTVWFIKVLFKTPAVLIFLKCFLMCDNNFYNSFSQINWNLYTGPFCVNKNEKSLWYIGKYRYIGILESNPANLKKVVKKYSISLGCPIKLWMCHFTFSSFTFLLQFSVRFGVRSSCRSAWDKDSHEMPGYRSWNVREGLRNHHTISLTVHFWKYLPLNSSLVFWLSLYHFSYRAESVNPWNIYCFQSLVCHCLS